jgi:adenylate cyclase
VTDDDFKRFAIDPSSELADDRVAVAHFLLELGEDLETIRATGDARELFILAWTHILGVEGDPLSRDEAAKLSGLDPERTGRILRALGFTDVRSRTLRSKDIDLVNYFAAAADFLGEESTLQLARIIASSMKRVAEANASVTRVSVEAPYRAEGSYPDFLREANEIVSAFLPALSHAFDRLHRYKLLESAEQTFALDAARTATTMEVAVGFADMVGFTARSGKLSTTELAKVVDRFETRVADAITGAGGRAVKFLGDEVMFVFYEAEAACACARQLVAIALDDDEIPDVRGGIAFGEVLARYGDYYGPTVNLASRLCDVAPAGAVLVTAEAAAQAPSFEFEQLPPTPLKGVEQTVKPLRLV